MAVGCGACPRPLLNVAQTSRYNYGRGQAPHPTVHEPENRSKLAQHNRAYDAALAATAVEPLAAQRYFATTKEALIAVWGKNQRYYYLGSDPGLYYLKLYYDTYFKQVYYYKIPGTTEISESRFEFSKEPSPPQRIEIMLR